MAYDGLIKEFDENGYAVLHDVFPPSKIAAVSSAVDEVIEGRSAFLPAAEIV